MIPTDKLISSGPTGALGISSIKNLGFSQKLMIFHLVAEMGLAYTFRGRPGEAAGV
jgi:hypothetical protein